LRWHDKGWGALLLALAACSPPASEPKAADPVALVTLAPAQAGSVAAHVTLYGQVEAGPGSDRTLSAPVESNVAAIDVPVGGRVAPGTVVVRLNGSLQSALDLAKARNDASTAAAALARAQRLRADGLVGNAEVETARQAAQNANATRASLTARAGGLALSSPVAGVVDAVLQKPGDLVAAGAPIARIAAGGPTRARLGIDPTLAAQIQPGSTVAVSAVGGGQPLRLGVAGVDRIVDPATRLASVFATIPVGSGLAIGQAIEGTLVRPEAQGGVTIPYAAVLDDGGQPYVYVVKGGVAKKHDVKLGPHDGDRVLVTSGVGAGEAVVVAGGTAVEDGMKVRTGPMAAAKPDAKAGG
jgi:RND family efflux transporter MFP subunit